MVAIIRMGVVVHPAVAKIKQMRHNNQYHGYRQYPNLVAVPVLLGKQQQNAHCKNCQRPKAMMMFTKAMPERITANKHGQHYHKVLESMVFNDLIPQYWQACQEQGQQCAVNGAGYGSTDTQYVPVDLHFH